MDLRAALMHYVHIGEVASRTRSTLASGLLQLERSLPEERRPWLRQALRHLEDVREGFVISLRTSESGSLEELRHLLQQVLLSWDWAEEMGLEIRPPDRIEAPDLQLVAYAHSWVSMGLLPRLSPQVITYPVGRRSYADIPVPRRPAEVLERIEELERALTVLEHQPMAGLAEPTVKRTYGFFETSAWLVDYHRRLFFGEA